MEGHICPHCGNPVFDEDALLCHFCGESLQRAADRLPLGGQGFLGRIRYANRRVVWYFLTFLVLCALTFLFLR